MKNKLSPLLGRSLATGLASMFILPTPWVTIWFYRWWIAQLRVSDGSTVEFRGTVGQIWLPLVILPVQAYFFYVIISWFTQNVHPSSGTALSFHRSWIALIGWWLLSLLSVFTIIGWAWVYSAMGRWYGQNIQSGGN